MAAGPGTVFFAALRERFCIPEKCNSMTPRQTKQSLLVGRFLVGALSVYSLLTGRPGDVAGEVIGMVVGEIVMTFAVAPEILAWYEAARNNSEPEFWPENDVPRKVLQMVRGN